MMRTSRSVVACCAAASLALVLGIVAAPLRAQGTPIGFEEHFALAEDRAAALESLIPGTEEAYYYSCLERQHAGALNDVPPILQAWLERHGRTERYARIEKRQWLLAFNQDPASTYAYLRSQIGLRFDHERRVPGQTPDLPTRLDPALIDRQHLRRLELTHRPHSLSGFTPAALSSLVSETLDDRQLADLLRRLERPDHRNLPALVVRELSRRESRGFGALPIHRKLLLSQLEQCLAMRPALLDDPEFVSAWARQLQPAPGVDWRHDATLRQAYLTRLQSFAERLAPAHNSFKAHVLYHRLVHDRGQGVYDRARFMAYVRLPRHSTWMEPRYSRKHSSHVSLGEGFQTGLAAVGDDEPLVRAYLEHFFQRDDSYAPFSEYVREDYLKRVFAETRILAGDPDGERWYSMLDDPAYYEQVKERVEIGFVPTQAERFGADEAVSIEVELKNVPTLLVKVFEINTFNVYSETEQEIDASLDLDGLVANAETTHRYDDGPFLRVRKRFEFPSLRRPGLYVVDFIGNGLQSRAVVRKGGLRVQERLGSAGHVFRVLDEGGQLLRDASAWFAGREYDADDLGDIHVPYSTDPGRRNLIVRHDGRASLHSFDHQAETYRLDMSTWLERETLLPGDTARLLVRAGLFVNGRPASLELLEDVQLELTSQNVEGVRSTLEVRDFTLSHDAESVHEFVVPDDLETLFVSLNARVESLTRGERQNLASGTKPFSVNGLVSTTETACPLLGQNEQGYVLDVLGRNGEPRADLPVRLELRHEEIVDPVKVTLKTDARGRIQLGALSGITEVRAPGMPGSLDSWLLGDAQRTWPSRLHAAQGSTLQVPVPAGWGPGAPERSAVSLLERRGGSFSIDRFEHLARAGAFLELRDLPMGEYSLWLAEPAVSIEVRVVEGAVRQGWVVGAERMLPLEHVRPLAVAQLGVEGDALRVRLRHARPDARVHVVASRFQEGFDPFVSLLMDSGRGEAVSATAPWLADYRAGRSIGDEYRYILERRYATKFPGNMLARPGLLLNPWELEETSTAIGVGGGGGGGFGRAGKAGGRSQNDTMGARSGAWGHSPSVFPDMSFLPAAPVVHTNLRPDADGVVSVPLEALGPGHQVHVLVLDDESTIYRSLALPETTLKPKDVRLNPGLDPSRQLSEQRRIDVLAAGATAVIEDVATSEVELYDSLASVYRLFTSLSDDGSLEPFAELLEWPSLDEQARSELYGELASHELHLFLHEKDPEYFARVVRPYLAHKLDKTFLDHWLLGDDLSAYLAPWAFQRLNVLERILLGRRLPAQAASVALHLEERLELRPVDPERRRQLFDAALFGNALDTGASLGLAVRDAKKNLARNVAAMTAPAPTEAAEAMRSYADADESGELKEQLQALGYLSTPDAEEEFESGGAAALTGRGRKVSADVRARGEVQRLYRAPDRTREYVEHNYWHRRIAQHNEHLIPLNEFWLDLAQAPEGTPFVSPHVAQASGHVNEMVLALAMLDLPFEAAEHEQTLTDGRMTFRAGSPALLVRKEITAAEDAEEAAPILVSQDVFRLDDRYRYEGSERFDKFVDGELLTGVVYGCQVVVTNPTSSPRRLELLLQIPEGAIPVAKGFKTRGVDVALQPFGTTTQAYHWYVPAVGDFSLYPAQVARRGERVAGANARSLHVVAEPTVIDTTSWEHVSQNGTLDEVLAYLASHNLERLELSDLAWRARDEASWETLLTALRGRHAYDHTLWSYALHHERQAAAREFLANASSFVTRCGVALSSPLLEIDPVVRRSYQHIEYEPLFNPRAHSFGRERRILNGSLARQYASLMEVLAHRPRLDDADWLSVTYYLLLQDRVEEALQAFARVRRDQVGMNLQYDYAAAYLLFFSPDPTRARGLAEPYRDHPVPRWRARFRDVLAQLDEAEGLAVTAAGDDDRTREQTALAAAGPSLELELEGQRLTLRHANLDSVELNLYAMDIEFLFSTSPFVQQGSGAFAHIRPNRSLRVPLSPDEDVTTIELPEAFASSNVLVEVRGEGLVRREPYYANTLSVRLMENYGQLEVTHAEDGRPLPAVYVKVYARVAGGGTRFHKDGYTDLRGRFDYASLSGDGIVPAEAYGLLVLSDEYGAVIREVAPPRE